MSGPRSPGPRRPPGPGRDSGLQPERTRLAWRRTTLTCTVTAVLAVKATLREGRSAVPWLFCALCVALWLAFVALTHHRIRLLSPPAPPASHAPPTPHKPPTRLTPTIPRTLSPRLALATAAATTGFALCAWALLLWA